jgi:dTDP-4-amino-4,6-dideoxygalactose transaminase
MQVLEKHIGLRRSMHQFYYDYFETIEGVTVLKESNENIYSNHWLSCIVLDANILGKTAEDLRLALEAENVESRPLWKPMHLQPIFEKYPYFGKSVSEKLFANGLCLPSGSNLGNSDRERITAVFNRFFSK